jgi:hypothetical protein
MLKLIISKNGFSVTAAQKDLIFTSELDCLKEKISGNATTNSSGNLTITHNLGYIPAFTVFVASNADQSVWYPQDKATVYATSTTLVISGAMGGITSKVYYALFSSPL